MLFFGHDNDLEFFLRWIVTTARALIWRLASASAFLNLNTTFFFLFFFLFFLFLFLLIVFCPLLLQPEPFFVFRSLRMLDFFIIWVVWSGFVWLCLPFLSISSHYDGLHFFSSQFDTLHFFYFQDVVFSVVSNFVC